jgi:hypothetical protein
MSAEARKRIADAQKRWAAFHAKKRSATRTAKKVHAEAQNVTGAESGPCGESGKGESGEG